MDIGTVKMNTKSDACRSSRECLNDIFAVFTNSYIFNAIDTNIAGMGRRLGLYLLCMRSPTNSIVRVDLRRTSELFC